MNWARQAFDRHAAVYDQVFFDRLLRSEVWQTADRYLSPGMRVLDLGCGTGDDAIHFARRGLRVTAVDFSSEMISRLRLKADAPVQTAVADIRTYVPEGKFDLIFSNFGALNCCADLKWLSQLARRSLSPTGHVILTTMGRVYPLECLVFLIKGRPDLALRRCRQPAEAMIDGIPVAVYHHSVNTIHKTLGVEFVLKQVTGLRAFLPVPGFEHLERFRTLRPMKPLDRWWCSNRWTATWSDHFVTVWRYRETSHPSL